MPVTEGEMLGFVAGLLLMGLYHSWKARTASWLLSWSHEESVSVPRREASLWKWVPAHFDPLAIIHLTFGWGPWRRPRTVIRKVSTCLIEGEGFKTFDRDSWKGNYLELYWEDTGKPLSFMAARRVEKLRKHNQENAKRRKEAEALADAALALILQPSKGTD